ncbi:MAG: BamA/TamA family outer membrane protein [Sphingomonadales bacterium]|nr:BamA/TamA family outer membrane protein [Sphingomonadales bacterium]
MACRWFLSLSPSWNDRVRRHPAVGTLSLLTLLWAGPLAARQGADPDLKTLIPDSAVADPQGWARGAAPPAPASPLNPQSPMAAAPDLKLGWPDAVLVLPPLVPLPPEAGLAGPAPQDVVLPVPEVARASARALYRESFASRRVSLDFAQTAEGFPERAAFEARFRQLSAVALLPLKEQDNIGQLAVRAATDRDLLLRLLRIYGYYDGDVTQSIAGLVPGARPGTGGAKVSFEIVPGPRYVFGAIALGALADSGSDYPALRTSFGIQTGDPLHADAIVAGRASLGDALAESGYPFARLADPELTVDHRSQNGDLAMPVTPGGKYAFGQVVSLQPHFLSSRHLARIARLKPGEVYKKSKVEDLRQAILATGLVSSVTVTPRPTTSPTAGAAGDVALDVGMTKARPRTAAAEIGYDTAEGFRLETSWEYRNLLKPEGMLRLRAVAGTEEQLVGTTLRFTNFRARDQDLTIDLFADNANLIAYSARKVDFTATFERLSTLIFQKPWVWSVGVEEVASAEREGMPSGTFLNPTTANDTVISYAGIPRTNYLTTALPLRVAYDGSDNLLDPQRGWRVALRVSPEVAFDRGTSVTYVSGQFDLSSYQPVASGVVFAERVRLGMIAGAPLEEIAPSRRFYAGGGGSIRGFGYLLVGPRVNGVYTGGRSLYEFSLESRMHTGLFGGALSLVPFLDAGGVDSQSTLGFRDMRYAAGLGLRYNTGFGPLRIDIGTPLDRRPGESRVGVNVALGQAF